MLNLITDIAGIRIGNAHDSAVMSGATVALFERPNIASCVVSGGAPGLRDATLLEPDMTVECIDAVVLSGGSAFGLDAAGGVMSGLREADKGLQVGAIVVPIVVQAITFDLLNGGNNDWGRMPPYWEMGRQAVESAQAGRFPIGSVGGGYGASTVNFKGALGSTSAVTPSGFAVGAIVVVNAIGAVTIGDSRHFWAAPYEVGREFGGHGQPQSVPADATQLRVKGGGPPSTTIGLIATDATLTKAQAKRVAIMADDGLARAVRPAHAPMDGDSVFAVSTCAKPLSDPPAQVMEIGATAADCLARAIARAVYEATIPPGNWQGPPAYQDVYA